MSLLYKYRKFNEYTNNISTKSELCFSTFDKFNDPFDCNLDFRNENTYIYPDLKDFKKEIAKKRGMSKRLFNKNLSLKGYAREHKKFILDMKNESGILSMSKTCANILMWSHYADDHKGLCFGFMALESNDECFKKGTPVSYSKDEIYTPINVFSTNYEEELTRLFSTKSKYWEYEEEFRFITINSNGLKNFSKESLREIIFGCSG